MAKAKTSTGLEENIASVLCYVLAWITGIIFFLIEKDNKTVRFHALQSILTFLPLTILSTIFSWVGAPKWTYGTGYYGLGALDPGIPALIYLSWIISAITLILWIILIIKAYQGEKFKIPIVGDIAEKNA
jgi:uncharacterized membrane protein